MTDPHFYREYECNLSAPYIRAWKALKTPRLEADVVSAKSYENLPLDPDFSHTVCTGIQRNVSSFSIGPDQCPELDHSRVAGIFEMVTLSDTTTGWYRGWIRGTEVNGVSGQLTVNNLESVPINFNQKIGTINLNTITVDLNTLVALVEWKITIFTLV